MTRAVAEAPFHDLEAGDVVRLNSGGPACYIFLDFDGVLNSLRSFVGLGGGGTAEKLDPVAIGLIDRLCRDLRVAGLNPYVVISSSWRKGREVQWFKDLFAVRAANLHVVGKTPSLASGVRGEEVRAWLIEHASVTAPHVCFDDDSDFLAGQPLVLTTFAHGLQIEHIATAFTLLTGLPRMPGVPTAGDGLVTA